MAYHQVLEWILELTKYAGLRNLYMALNNLLERGSNGFWESCYKL